MLHLVGVTHGLTSQRASREFKASRLIRLAQGVYCEEDDLEDLPGFMKNNAIRIANYMFPGTALVQSSAFYRGAVESDKAEPNKPAYQLFIAGKYARTVSLQYLEIVQSHALKNERLQQYCLAMEDGNEHLWGQMSMMRASDELIFLQNFGRRRYNTARFLSDDTMIELRRKLEARHGDQLISRLRAMADNCVDYGEELGRALEMLRMPIEVLMKEEEVANVYDFTLGWYGRPIAQLSYNGVDWNYGYKDGWVLPLSCDPDKPGRPPAFIANMFPEGMQLEALRMRMNSTNASANVLSTSERYLSNVSIVSNPDRLNELQHEHLHGKLNDFIEHGTFLGKVNAIPSMGGRFVAQLNEIVSRQTMPRISGMQAKIPMYLDEDGYMYPADGKPFTHILKLPGISNDHLAIKGSVEWASMELARSTGLKTCDFAMVELSGKTIGYVCERFDIPKDEDDVRMLFSEDFCAALGHGPNFKMFGNAADVTRIFNEHVTPMHKVKDAEELLRLFVTNYLLENGDFHLKNLAFLKVASPTLNAFKSVRLSPAFDIMNTHFFSPLEKPEELRESMILEINGKDNHFGIEDFIVLGKSLGIEEDRVAEIHFEAAKAISQKAREMIQDLPPILSHHEESLKAVTHLLERATLRCHEEYVELPAGLGNRTSGVAPK